MGGRRDCALSLGSEARRGRRARQHGAAAPGRGARRSRAGALYRYRCRYRDHTDYYDDAMRTAHLVMDALQASNGAWVEVKY